MVHASNIFDEQSKINFGRGIRLLAGELPIIHKYFYKACSNSYVPLENDSKGAIHSAHPDPHPQTDQIGLCAYLNEDCKNSFMLERPLL